MSRCRRGQPVISCASSRIRTWSRFLPAQGAGEIDAAIDLVGGDVQGRPMPLIRKGEIMTSIVSLLDTKAAAPRGIRATFTIGDSDLVALQEIGKLIDDGKK